MNKAQRTAQTLTNKMKRIEELEQINAQLLEACKLAFEELKPQYRAWGKLTTMGKLETAITNAEGISL